MSYRKCKPTDLFLAGPCLPLARMVELFEEEVGKKRQNVRACLETLNVAKFYPSRPHTTPILMFYRLLHYYTNICYPIFSQHPDTVTKVTAMASLQLTLAIPTELVYITAESSNIRFHG